MRASRGRTREATNLLTSTPDEFTLGLARSLPTARDLLSLCLACPRFAAKIIAAPVSGGGVGGAAAVILPNIGRGTYACAMVRHLIVNTIVSLLVRNTKVSTYLSASKHRLAPRRCRRGQRDRRGSRRRMSDGRRRTSHWLGCGSSVQLFHHCEQRQPVSINCIHAHAQMQHGQ